MAYNKFKTEQYALLGGMNSKASPYDNRPNEFRYLSNFNFRIPGAITKRPGTSLYIGASVLGRITGGVEFDKLDGSSYIVVAANTNAYTVTSTYNAFKTGLSNGALFDFTTFVDRLFCANGVDFFKFDGANATNYGLPEPPSGWGVTAVVGGGLSGIFVASYGYLNDIGYYGPTPNGITISLNGVTFGSIQYYGLTSFSGYGASAIQLYRSSAGGVDLFGTTLATIGTTTVTDIGWSLTTVTEPTNIWFTLAPKYLELYNNQLFMAGFSGFPSDLVWSDIGTPESVQPDYNIEVRTNDGDRITGMRPYNGALIITKEKSFHRLQGDNPDNFLLSEISDQYGNLSNRAMVNFQNVIWFLDTKGICEFNGANISIVSEKVEPVFRAMNISAARDNAVGLHNRLNNEVWFGIPTNGATLINTLVVYDYIAQAWTIYEGHNISSLWYGQGSLPEQSPIYGGYTGNVIAFGNSIMSDLGNGFTCLARTKFVADSGEAQERQYRRFYINLEPVLGVTQPINVNFYKNYGTDVQLTRTMYQAPFQSRLEFGIPARSIQAEWSHYSASLPCTIYGYTFESRFQRDI